MHYRPYLSIPQFLEAPEYVVRGLREIRPSAELFYWGNGTWSLGEMSPKNYKIITGNAILAQMTKAPVELRNASTIFTAQLLNEGFSLIRDYKGDPDGRIVNDYQRMCWKEDHGVLDSELTEVLERTLGVKKLAGKIMRIRERINADAKSDHKILFRHRKSVGPSINSQPQIVRPALIASAR